jgi:hypothetical protein
VYLIRIENDDLAGYRIVLAPHAGKAFYSVPDDSDRQSFMGMPPEGVFTIACVQKLDVAKIIGAPELRPFTLEQLLLSTVHLRVSLLQISK